MPKGTTFRVYVALHYTQRVIEVLGADQRCAHVDSNPELSAETHVAIDVIVHDPQSNEEFIGMLAQLLPGIVMTAQLIA